MEKGISTQVHTACTRARARGLSATLSVDEWNLTLKDFKYLCVYCGKPGSTLDHFIPLAHSGGTCVDNCVPSCRECNTLKGHLLPHQVKHVSKKRIEQIRRYLSNRQTEQPYPEIVHPTTSLVFVERKEKTPMAAKEEQQQTREQQLSNGEKILLYDTPEHIVLRLSKSSTDPLQTTYALGIPLNKEECILLARDLLDIASTYVPTHKVMDLSEMPFSLGVNTQEFYPR